MDKSLPTLCAAILLSSCATPSLLLLEDEGSGNGAISILEAKGQVQETVIESVNSRTPLTKGQPVSRQVNGKNLTDSELALLNVLPPPPSSFTVYFMEGTTNFAPGSEPIIAAVREDLKYRLGAEIQVTGHTDRLGSDEDNDRLSRLRAEEIATLLIGLGFDAESMSVVGRGEREPLVKTEDGRAHPGNRRVEIIVR